MKGAVTGDNQSVEDQVRTVELAEILEFVADFLARAEGPMLRFDFAEFTCGTYELDVLRGDLRRFARWLMGEGFA